LQHAPYSFDLSPPDFVTKTILKGHGFSNTEEVTAKSSKSTYRVIKMASRIASESFINIGKSMSLPKETTLKIMLSK
jgi:hypothetical protein